MEFTADHDIDNFVQRLKIEPSIRSLPPFELLVLDELIKSKNERFCECIRNYYLNQNSKSKYQLMILNSIVTHSLDISYELWRNLFADYSTDKAKLIAKSGPEVAEQPIGNLSLVYGEIDFFSLANIIERADVKEGNIFVDLGHGTGKALICASLLYGQQLSKVIGIELVSELCSISSTIKESFFNAVSANPLFHNQSKCEIVISEGDFLADTSWITGDIVFTNSTCFDDSLMTALASVAAGMSPGSKFISLTKQLPSDQFRLVDRRQYNMSWGEATCFTTVRI